MQGSINPERNLFSSLPKGSEPKRGDDKFIRGIRTGHKEGFEEGLMQGSEGMFEVLKAMQAIQTIITPLLRQGGQEAIVPQAEVRDIEDAVKRASSVARSYIQYTGRRLNRFRK